MVCACLVLCVGRYDSYRCSGQCQFAFLARYNFDKDIRGFLICHSTLQLEYHGTVAVCRVSVVRNLGPKFFGGSRGGYCIHRSL
jgi:hypothetical protein